MAIKLKDLAFDIEKTLEGKILLLEEPRVYEGYKEGVKTGAEGLAYTCLCEGLNYEKQTIKIAGSIQPPFEYNGTPIPVEFEGLEGKVWQEWSNKGEIRLSVSAKGIKPIAEKRIKLGGDKA